MRRALLLAIAALPLLAFDCGGSEPDTGPSGPTCRLAIRGEVSEDLPCVVTVFDYSVLTPEFPEFTFELLAYRGAAEMAASAAFWLPARAATGTAYGWDSAIPATNVEAGDAARYDATLMETHAATAPWGDAGTGKLSVTLTRIPAASATPDPLNVHGTLTGTLPSTGGGAPVTFSATF